MFVWGGGEKTRRQLFIVCGDTILGMRKDGWRRSVISVSSDG